MALGREPAEQVQESHGRHQHKVTIWQHEVREAPVSKRSSLLDLTNLQPMIRHDPDTVSQEQKGDSYKAVI